CTIVCMYWCRHVPTIPITASSFPCFVPPPDPHSFPTRRSSDLSSSDSVRLRRSCQMLTRSTSSRIFPWETSRARISSVFIRGLNVSTEIGRASCRERGRNAEGEGAGHHEHAHIEQHQPDVTLK